MYFVTFNIRIAKDDNKIANYDKSNSKKWDRLEMYNILVIMSNYGKIYNV